MFRPETDVQKDIAHIKKSGRFDAAWYLETYKDVGMLGMDPVEHFVRFGQTMQRDPSPDFNTAFYLDTFPVVTRKNLNVLAHHVTRKGSPKDPSPDFHYTLWAAHREALRSGHQQAITLAQKYLPEDLQYTVNTLQGNAALAEGAEERWLHHLNSYLEHFKLAPLTLKPTGPSLLSRMTTDDLPVKRQGKKISVLIPAWNAQDTVPYAVRSILRQTWGHLEVIIVDDASTDGTWDILKKLQASDSRIKIFRNKVNVGPYVSKNIALQHATGDYVTGHDADDWAHPQRLENHIRAAEAPERPLKASLTYMVRIRPDGYFGHIGKVTGFSRDGVIRKASISCLFDRKTLTTDLGYWDTVRFGADSEMISRATSLLGDEFAVLEQVGMICLDLETSLTNHPVHGVDKTLGVSPIRANYRDGWINWHKEKMTAQSAYLDFPQKSRRYEAAPEMVVPVAAIDENIARTHPNS